MFGKLGYGGSAGVMAGLIVVVSISPVAVLHAGVIGVCSCRNVLLIICCFTAPVSRLNFSYE